MNVKFNLKSPSEQESLIFAVCRFNGQKFKYSTRIKIPTKFWKGDRIQNSPQFVNKNNTLKAIRGQLNDAFSWFQSQKMIPSNEQLKEEMDRRLNRSKKDSPNSFYGFFERYIEDRINDPIKPIAASTAATFRRVKKVLREYRPQADFQHIDEKFYKGLIRLLVNKGHKKNSQATYIKKLKQVLSEAEKDGLYHYASCKNWIIPKADTFGIYYSEQELMRLLKHDFGSKKYLERVRDHFVLGSYIGARYSDYISLDKSQIKTLIDDEGQRFDSVTYAQKKSGKSTVVSIPLHPIASQILEKYHGKFPPKISNVKYNLYLKEMARIAGFIEKITIPSQDGSNPQTKEKWELTTTHTARRNFISNAKNRGMADSDIMLFSGHKSQQSFALYNKTTAEENAVRLRKSSFFRKNVNNLKVI